MKNILYQVIPKYRGIPIYRASFWRNIYQKVKYGFNDVDLFSLDYHLTKLIYPRIRAFREEYEAHPFNVPDEFLKYEQDRMLKKGAKWNSQWARLDDKKLEQECWDRAVAKWTKILKAIEDGFADELLEEVDWDRWRRRWQPECDYINKKIEKATTKEKREEIWNSMKCDRKYREGYKATHEDVCYSMRQEAKRLLFEHYNKLWR